MLMKNISAFFLILLTYSAMCFSQVAEKAENVSPLLIGEKIPDGQLTTLEGELLNIRNVISEKQTILVVYRGGWCIYCNKQLAGLAEIQDDVSKLGYQIIAISPDAPNKVRETKSEKSLTFQLFSDNQANLIKAMGLAFSAPDKLHNRLSDYSNKQNPNILPVPAVFVLNTSGEILFEHINPNYSERISPDFLLAVLKALKE